MINTQAFNSWEKSWIKSFEMQFFVIEFNEFLENVLRKISNESHR